MREGPRQLISSRILSRCVVILAVSIWMSLFEVGLSQNSRWVCYGTAASTHTKMYYDSESIIKIDRQHWKVWTKYKVKAQPWEFVLWLVDGKERTMEIVASRTGDGPLTESNSEAQAVVPESIGESLMLELEKLRRVQRLGR